MTATFVPKDRSAFSVPVLVQHLVNIGNVPSLDFDVIVILTNEIRDDEEIATSYVPEGRLSNFFSYTPLGKLKASDKFPIFIVLCWFPEKSIWTTTLFPMVSSMKNGNVIFFSFLNVSFAIPISTWSDGTDG